MRAVRAAVLALALFLPASRAGAQLLDDRPCAPCARRDDWGRPVASLTARAP
jgi:hypothetical protein